MEQIDPQLKNDLDPKEIPEEIKGEKNRNKKLTIIISVVAAVVMIAAVVLYVFLYKIPYDEAVVGFNNAADRYHAAVTALDDRNKELNDSIMSLNQVIHTENIPIDEFLLLEANSVLEEARNIPKDSALPIPEMPKKPDEIKETTAKILESIPEVQAMGDYSETIELLSATKTEYQAMIDLFKSCESDVVWFGVDEENTVLRFVVQLSNPNTYTLRGVATEWIVYDKNDAIVGSFDGTQPDIPANDSVYYVGGAGSANLSGMPARVEVKITSGGLLTNRKLPQIALSNIQIKNNGFNWFTVFADCVADADIKTVDLDGQIIIKDANGQILEADFWSAENLPDSIDAGGKFAISEDFFDLSAMPEKAEVYMYYKMQ